MFDFRQIVRLEIVVVYSAPLANHLLQQAPLPVLRQFAVEGVLVRAVDIALCLFKVLAGLPDFKTVVRHFGFFVRPSNETLPSLVSFLPRLELSEVPLN